ncbi:MAG TPA: hypothetical protein PKC95_07945 [Thauera aminoaromatica]|nr:hypothetical protein [Thauera aminoaromatica]
MTEAEITDIFGPRCAVFNARCGSCLMWRAHDEYAALVAAARAVSVASAAITLHPDGRAYFDSGAATKHFRGALAALLEVLDEVLRHG